MPWLPELFSAPALQKILDQRHQEELAAMPFFDGLLAGEPDALIDSFAGEPKLEDPVRGRVEGKRAFAAFVADWSTWLTQRNVSVEGVAHVVLESRGFEEVVLHVDSGSEGERIALPLAIVADRPGGRIDELRLYFSTWPLTGRHLNRPPLLQLDPALRVADVVAEFQRALAAGDVEAIVATFEPDGYTRDPVSDRHVYRGADALRMYYERLISGGGGLVQEHCGLVDDGRTCALEYNLVRRGGTRLTPQAGVAVYVQGQRGRVAAARFYDDADLRVGPGM